MSDLNFNLKSQKGLVFFERCIRDRCIDDVDALEKSGKLFTEDSFKNLATTFKERSGNVIKADVILSTSSNIH